MNKCKCCNNISNGYTCSKHIYDYRYLKKFDISEQDMESICNVETSLSIKYKMIMWKNGLSSHPTCPICEKKLSDKKILVDNGSSSLCCSSECYSIFKINNKESNKGILDNISRDIKRELKKFSDVPLEEYVTLLLNKYNNISSDLLFINKLYINNMDDIPKCKFCNIEHYKTRHQNISDCCSVKCANSYKNSKMSYNEILNYYIKRDIPIDFLINIDSAELSSVYSNQKRDINKCHCGNFTINKYCSEICRNKDDMLNIKKFNYDGFIEFINNNKFDSIKAMEFFNCSISTINRYKEKFGIKVRNKYTVEDDVILEISKFLSEYPKRNDRSAIKPKELDILYKNFAIEYNGLAWHSNGKINIYDNIIDSNMHMIKTNLCEFKNIKLFHIFENEWKNKRSIWTNILYDFCNNIKHQNYISVHSINLYEAQKFIDINYLEQIDITHFNNIALKEENKIISICSFENNKMKLFCTNKYNFDITLIEQCIKFYLSQNNYSSIDIYFNRRWQHYQLNDNFKFIEHTSPNKYYIVDNWRVINETDYISHYSNDDNFREIHDSGYSIVRYTEKCIN